MKLESIEIRDIRYGELTRDAEGMEHVKSLPCLSVVQSVHGHYEIGLDGDLLQRTGQGGAFAAPAGNLQRIIHHNGAEGFMHARWVFMNVTVNGGYRLEDVQSFPLIVPECETETLHALFSKLAAQDLCERYIAAYGMVQLLLRHGAPRTSAVDETAARIEQYVAAHYREKITREALAKSAFCSVPHLYRIFQRHFGMSPANYVNQVRLQNAVVLLETSRLPVSRIAEQTGFEDAAYFARLFRRRFSVSPGEYRRQNRRLNG